jgi:OmpA-OmpF porin, OOP family
MWSGGGAVGRSVVGGEECAGKAGAGEERGGVVSAARRFVVILNRRCRTCERGRIMSSPRSRSFRRYRRRIVGWGLLVLVVIFVVGAVITLGQVERDLEDRVDEALAEAGFVDVSVEFSGQDGTVRCAQPLATLDQGVEQSVAQLVRVAEQVDGVRVISVDAGCGDAGDAEPDGPSATFAPTSSVDGSAAPSTSEGTATTAIGSDPAVTSTTEVGGVETVATLIAQDPQFSQFAALLERTGLIESLNDPGPFTVLAPTDAAFDAAFDDLGADAFESLINDVDRSTALLLRHVTDVEFGTADLVSGSVEMRDGSEVVIDASGPTFQRGDVVAALPEGAEQQDIVATNGIVHAVDRVFLSDDLADPSRPDPPVDPDPSRADAVLSGVLADGRITLSGTVASEEQRQRLVDAARFGRSDANVVDELDVAPLDQPLDPDLVDGVVLLIAAMPTNLVDGTVVVVDDGLRLTGIHLGDAARDAMQAFAEQVGAETDLSPRAVADAATAQALQDSLNEFVRSEPITFESNAAELTTEAEAVLEQVAARALRLEAVRIAVIGHTDSEGDPGRNLALSEQRSETVRDELVRLGFPADRLTTEGRGLTEPILDASGVEDRAASRRVEFEVEVGS